MKQFLLLCLLVISTINQFKAQSDWMPYPASNSSGTPQNGKIKYEEDSRTSKLIEFMSAPVPPEYKVLLDGYRVQIFFSNDRELINKQRDKFNAQHPAVPSFIVYDAPNYSIKVGNFRTELEAEELRSKVSIDFPSSIIQKSKIELPAIKSPSIAEEGN
jgi:hypothetical protein